MAKIPISKFLFSVEEEIIRTEETNTFSVVLKIKPRWFAKPFLYLRGFIALISEKYFTKYYIVDKRYHFDSASIPRDTRSFKSILHDELKKIIYKVYTILGFVKKFSGVKQKNSKFVYTEYIRKEKR